MKRTGLNRSFGLLLAGVFTLLSVMAYWENRQSYVFWAALVAVFLVISLFMPRVLAPLRRAWLRFGRLLGRIMNPVLLGVIYALVFIPFGRLMRLFRRDALARRRTRPTETYWTPVGRTANADSLREQF
jgi:hypothetical protein